MSLPEPKSAPMSRYETFLTPRLEARALSWDHRDELLQLFGDPQVGATLGGVRGMEEVEEGTRHNLAHWDRWGWGIWTAYDRTREGYPFVGQLLLRNREIDNEEEVEIGYALMPQYWRQGLATEAAAALAWLGFEVLGLENLAAFTWVKNIGSRRVMEKIGMKEEKYFSYVELDHVLYRLKPGELITGQQEPAGELG